MVIYVKNIGKKYSPHCKMNDIRTKVMLRNTINHSPAFPYNGFAFKKAKNNATASNNTTTGVVTFK